MEPHITKTVNCLERLCDLGLLKGVRDLAKLRQKVIEGSRIGNQVYEAIDVFRDAEVPRVTWDDELDRLEKFRQGDMAHYIETLVKISSGEAEFVQVGEDLWMQPGGRDPAYCDEKDKASSASEFRVWFKFKGKRYDVGFPQRWDRDWPRDELLRLVNGALKEHGIAKRFVYIMDTHFDRGGEIFADPDALKTLQDEGLIGKLPKITEDYV